MTRFALIATLLCAGCTTPPPARCDGINGFVRADSTADACELAALMDRFVPEVARILPALKDKQLEIWIEEKLYRDDLGGVCYGSDTGSPRIVLKKADELDWILVHELTHAAIDDDFRGLSPIIREGICEQVAYMLVDDVANRVKFQRTLAAARFFGLPMPAFTVDTPEHTLGLRMADGKNEISLSELLELDHVRESQPDDYAMAFFLVHRIVESSGLVALERLSQRALAQDELASPDSLLGLAGYSAENDVREHLTSLLAPEAFRAYARVEAKQFAETLIPSLKGHWATPDEALREANPRIIRSGVETTHLAPLPEIIAAVREVWARTGEHRRGSGIRIDKLFEGPMGISIGPRTTNVD